MDHAVLVDIDVNAGARIVEELESERIDFKVALFATFPEYYDPRLVFAAEWLDQLDPRTRYEKFGEALGEKFAMGGYPVLSIMKMTDPFIEDIRKKLGQFGEVRGMRLSGQSFGGRYLEDGYVYRIR